VNYQHYKEYEKNNWSTGKIFNLVVQLIINGLRSLLILFLFHKDKQFIVG
jgi:hypothetical protein